jgi:membrane-associated phospholipid phosphatase
MFWWHTVTFLGDSAFTVPCALAIAIWLSINGLWKQTVRWLLCFGVAMALVVVTKLLFMGWNIAPPFINFTGISGHSASATAVYLTAAFLFSNEKSERTRMLAIAAAIVFSIVIGLSRLAIKVHSESEVVIGLLTGAVAAWCFCRAFDGSKRTLRGKYVFVALSVFMLMGTTGKPAPTQGLLQDVAQMLSGRDMVYYRTIPL